MHNITLVCSGHRDNGLCNAGELLEILRAIEPEVVFEEMLPSDVDSYYKHGTKSSLESQAIKGYREFKSLQQVPVDRYDIPLGLLVEIKLGRDRVVDRVEQVSQEYRALNEEMYGRAYHFGFRYLNGVAFTAIMERTSEIEEKIIAESGDQGLIRAQKTWRHANQEREHAMIGNVYQYCKENVFDTGVFLVGAAHKTGVLMEIRKRAGTEEGLINWNFAFDGQI